MDEFKRRAITFLEKEIKTYQALSLFLAKKNIKERLRIGEKAVLLGPHFYKQRIKEATALITYFRTVN